MFPIPCPFIQRFGVKAHIGFKEALKLFSKHSNSTEQTGIYVKSNSAHMRKGVQETQHLLGATFMGYRRRGWGAVGCDMGGSSFQLTGLD